MKLILREYLSSLRERKELDALLPDLLSQMGLEVFSRPDVGGRQYGVDIAAFGSLDGGPESVYLLSVKSGDLGRNDWDGPQIQSLRPSLNEILDTYIPTHLPPEYKEKPIIICLCFGGDIKEAVRQNVSSYTSRNQTEQIKFTEWNGDVISGYIENHLLREELLPINCRPLLRKSIALLDEPTSSYRYFSKLINLLTNSEITKPEDTLTILRQINICLWVLYSWSRDKNNIECAYLASELATLHSWELSKAYFNSSLKVNIAIINVLHSTEDLYLQISEELIDKKIFPNANHLYALSSATSSSCAVEVNLKMFEILGRVALSGLWAISSLNQIKNTAHMKDHEKKLTHKVNAYHENIINIISNNPILISPYKDDHAIEIGLTILFLSLTENSTHNIHTLSTNIIKSSLFLYNNGGRYPCNLNSYYELLEHPNESMDYKKEVTAGSILYPLIAIISAIYKFDDTYKLIQDIKLKNLEHCNFQYWYINDASEDNFYTNKKNHGSTLSRLDVSCEIDEFLEKIFHECESTKYFQNLSSITFQCSPFPLALMACRHYRIPIPINLFYDLHQEIN
jgi:hypothetical protein